MYRKTAHETVPKKQWQRFCNTFSENHKGWRVTVLDVNRRTGSRSPSNDKRLVMNGLALQRISAEKDDGGLGLVIVAGEGANRMTHVVCDPARIRIEQARNGALKGLSFYSKDNQRTLVRFPLPVLS